MDETMKYMLDKLCICDVNFKKIADIFKNQAKLNKRLLLVAACTAITSVCTMKTVKEQNKKIEQIQNELEEMKKTKGE